MPTDINNIILYITTYHSKCLILIIKLTGDNKYELK